MNGNTKINVVIEHLVLLAHLGLTLHSRLLHSWLLLRLRVGAICVSALRLAVALLLRGRLLGRRLLLWLSIELCPSTAWRLLDVHLSHLCSDPGH